VPKPVRTHRRTGRREGLPLRAHYAPNQGRLRIATLTDIQLDQVLTVEAWRTRVLVNAGYPAEVAHLLALCPDVDLHQATDLLDNGCPPSTALEILL
jgi:hypothetical protein